MSSPHPNSIGNKFRSPHVGSRYTRVLFWEQQQLLGSEDKIIEPLYTLQVDKPGLINFRKAYVELGDPTGYQLAIRYLEDFAHWQLLMKSPWFREAKAVWDIELDAKLKSEGMNAIRMFADGIEGVAPAVQMQAAKYLAGLEYRKVAKPDAARGRPSKAEVAVAVKQSVEDTASIADDLARITLVKG